jgi:hypothetical protein
MRINNLAVTFFLVLTIKFLFFLLIFNNSDFFVQDSKSYIEISKIILNANIEISSTSRTFFYPLLIKFFYLLSDDFYINLTIIFQFSLSFVTGYLLYCISLDYFKDKYLSFLVFILFSIEPISNIFIFKISTETIFTFFLVLLLFFFQKFMGYNKNLKIKIFYLFLSSIILILLPTIRPIASYYKFIIFFFIIYSFYSSFNYKIFKSLFFFIIFFIIFNITSNILNSYIHKHLNYPIVSNIAELNFVEYILTHTIIINKDIDVKSAREEAKKNFYIHNEKIAKINITKVSKYILYNMDSIIFSLLESSLQLIFDPGDGLVIRNLYEKNIDFSGKSIDFHQMSKFDFLKKWYFNTNKISLTTISLFLMTIIILKVFFVTLAIFNNFLKNYKSVNYFYLFTFLYFIIISLGMQTNARFRVPLEPLIILYFVEGINLTVNYLKKNEKN